MLVPEWSFLYCIGAMPLLEISPENLSNEIQKEVAFTMDKWWKKHGDTEIDMAVRKYHKDAHMNAATAKSNRLEVARERSRRALRDLPSASNSSVDSGHRVGEEPASALELKSQVEDFWTPHLQELEDRIGKSGRSSSSRLTLLEQRIGDLQSSVARLTELEKHVRDFQSSVARLTELEKHSEETQSHVERMRKSFERDLIRVARGEMRRVNDWARCEEESIVTEVRSNYSCDLNHLFGMLPYSSASAVSVSTTTSSCVWRFS